MKIARVLIVIFVGLFAVAGILRLLRPVAAAPLEKLAAVGDHVILSEVF